MRSRLAIIRGLVVLALVVLLAGCSGSRERSAGAGAVPDRSGPRASTTTTLAAPSPSPSPSPAEVAAAVEVVRATDGLGDQVRACLAERMRVEPGAVADVLAGGGARQRAVVRVVRACERAVEIAAAVAAGDAGVEACVGRALAASSESELAEFRSRLLNGSLGDPGETAVGKDLGPCL